MGRTIAEKILADHSDDKCVSPGNIINVNIDRIIVNDVTGPIAIERLRQMGYEEVFDKSKVVFVLDHFTPNSSINAANQCKVCRDYAKKYSIPNFFDSLGIEHALLPERGLVMPGDLVIGADSHTCTHGALGAFSTGMGSTDVAVGMATGRIWLKVPYTIKIEFTGTLPAHIYGKDLILQVIKKIGIRGASYKAMELCGIPIKYLSIADRFTICNMAIEAGAKVGIIPADETVKNYIENISGKKKPLFYKSDADAVYESEYEVNVDNLEPQVAAPHSPENVYSVGDMDYVKLDQVIIGSCTNGWIEDLRIAAQILREKTVHPFVRLIIIPASMKIYYQALKEGLIEIFQQAGAIISTPTCGPCFGGHMGILASGEKCLSTTNRNFKGRMGDANSEIYLSNTAVAAASAVKGYIAHPAEVEK